MIICDGTQGFVATLVCGVKGIAAHLLLTFGVLAAFAVVVWLVVLAEDVHRRWKWRRK